MIAGSSSNWRDDSLAGDRVDEGDGSRLALRHPRAVQIASAIVVLDDIRTDPFPGAAGLRLD